MKAQKFLELFNEDAPVQPFLQQAAAPLQKDAQKDGTQITKQGKNLVINNPRTKKKVTLTDTGKDVKVAHNSAGKTDGPAATVRGSTDDLQKELDWVRNK